MTIKATHDMHEKRKSRNIGVALALVLCVIMIVVLTFVKLMRIEEERRAMNAQKAAQIEASSAQEGN